MSLLRRAGFPEAAWITLALVLAMSIVVTPGHALRCIRISRSHAGHAYEVTRREVTNHEVTCAVKPQSARMVFLVTSVLTGTAPPGE